MFNKVKKTYINLLEKYTSIFSTAKSIEKDSRAGRTGKFINGFECSMFLVTNGVYAIRFKDDISCPEFNQVFDILKNDLGLPNSFSEHDGYVWNQEGCIITFGNVYIGYDYSYPLICVRRSLTIFSRIIPYSKYIFIADSINKPLIDRGIDTREHSFCIINYSRALGYTTYLFLDKSEVIITYHKDMLTLSIIPLIRESKFKVRVITADQHKTQVLVKDVSTLEKKLDQLLEETKKYHRLTKIV